MYLNCRRFSFRQALLLVLFLALLAWGANAEHDPNFLFSCGGDGVILHVWNAPVSPPYYPYQLVSSAPPPNIPVWLDGGSYALAADGLVLTPGAGLEPMGATPSEMPVSFGEGVDARLGPYAFMSISWLANSSAAAAAAAARAAPHRAAPATFPAFFSAAFPSSNHSPSGKSSSPSFPSSPSSSPTSSQQHSRATQQQQQQQQQQPPTYSPPFPVVTNFTCYSNPPGGAPLIGMSMHFPLGVKNSALLNATERMLAPTATTSTRFPSFLATPASALRSESMGFIEWAGEMTSYQSTHGVSLQGYQGGQISGPLALFNATALNAGQPKAQAVVLGPASSFGNAIVGLVVEDSGAGSGGAATPQPCSCALAATGTDEVGAVRSPGYPDGVHAGTVAACCALCSRLGVDACDSYVFDTSGPAGIDCWPLLGTTSSKPATNRVLGFPTGRNASCAPSRIDTTALGGVAPPGFEAGVAVGSLGECCALCTILGPLVCQAYEFIGGELLWREGMNNDNNSNNDYDKNNVNSSSSSNSNCFVYSNVQGTMGKVNHTFALSTSTLRLAAGVHAYTQSLPPAFSTHFLLASSSQGTTDAVMLYGAGLRAAHQTTRIPRESDPLRHKVSYWSDNGAFYEDMYWTLFFQPGLRTPEIVLNRLKEYHASIGAHVGTYQMDPYWSYGVPPTDCGRTGSWPWAANWSGPEEFFPSGMAALDLPLTLYSNMFAAPPLNKMTAFAWNTSVVNFGGCPLSGRVVPSQSYDFHSYIFDLGVGWGMTNFEIDFLDWMELSFEDFFLDVRAFDEYFDGMGRAAEEHGIPVQFCMLLPNLALASVQWPAVTNARLQGDGNPYDTGRYDIFQSALLYASVGLAPFVDNFWTTSVQPAHDNPWGNETEPFTEGYAVLSALSAGVVGFGDGLGFTNMTMLNMTCRADGVLLTPSLPATPLDAIFADIFPRTVSSTSARIASAPSFIAKSNSSTTRPARGSTSATVSSSPYPYPYPSSNDYNYWTSIVAVYMSNHYNITPAHLSPPLPESSPSITGYYATQLSIGLDRLIVACADGANALLSCVQPFSSSQPLQISATSHDVWSVSPIFSSSFSSSSTSSALPASKAAGDGWSLLGELGKITRVSPVRFTAATPQCAGPDSFCFSILGVEGESVSITLVAPLAVVRVVVVEIPWQGTASVFCKGTGAASTCIVQ